MAPSYVIRFAMLAGVLLFGGVTWFLRRSPNFIGDYPAEHVGTLVMMGRILWGLVVLGCMVLLQMVKRAQHPARASSRAIAGWAMGESLALFGGVFWYLTGATSWYGAGLAFLVLTFLVFPATPRPR